LQSKSIERLPSLQLSPSSHSKKIHNSPSNFNTLSHKQLSQSPKLKYNLQDKQQQMFLDTSIKHIDFVDRIEMTKDNKRRA
jgi:hypothetical protein